MSNCTTNINSTFQENFLPPVFGVEFCVALLGNSLAIWLLLTRERRQWHTGIVFVFNLAVCDLLYVLSLPLLIGYYTNDKNWIFSDALCRIERFLFTCNLYGSIFFITCISLNRYVGIVHPFFMRSYVQPKHAMMVSLAVWFLVIGISSPVFHFSMTEEKGNTTECLGSATDDKITEYIPYSLFLASFGCALPFLATFVSYFAILVVVWKNDNITSADKRKTGVMIFTVIVLSKPSWADQVEEEGDEGTLPPPKEILKGNTKTIIEYKVDEDGKRFKIIRTFKIETRKASKAVARRKNWKKFGQSEFDAPGPNVATTTVSDDVYMTFISSKEDLNNQDEEDPMNKLKGQKIVSCRICKGDHWTTRCPYKDTLGPMQKELAEQLGLTTGDKEKTSEPEPAQPAQSKTGKYVPPSLRDGATRRGESMQPNRRADDNATIRVTNLSEDTRETDLQELFRPFGSISRIYLAKDKNTGQSKGFAFISFHRREDAARAIAGVSGFGYDHLILNVEWAK
ncbi:UNVERIFIED_CONTAM: hypothetical protein FKN15_059686 [Acipenser sinensis]